MVMIDEKENLTSSGNSLRLKPPLKLCTGLPIEAKMAHPRHKDSCSGRFIF